jgi:hypothetical protein
MCFNNRDLCFEKATSEYLPQSLVSSRHTSGGIYAHISRRTEVTPDRRELRQARKLPKLQGGI